MKQCLRILGLAAILVITGCATNTINPRRAVISIQEDFVHYTFTFPSTWESWACNKSNRQVDGNPQYEVCSDGESKYEVKRFPRPAPVVAVDPPEPAPAPVVIPEPAPTPAPAPAPAPEIIEIELDGIGGINESSSSDTNIEP